MMLAISTAHRAAILAHAATSDHEVCGLLLGRAGHLEEVRAVANVHADPARFFEIDPAALLAAHRAARGGGPAVIGHYHSHPSGRAYPSPRDAAEAAADGAIWIVAAAGELAAFRAVRDGPVHGRFEPVRLVACAPAQPSPEGDTPCEDQP